MFALKKPWEVVFKENATVCIVRRSMLQTLLRWELPTSIHILWFNYHMFIHLDNIGSSHISLFCPFWIAWIQRFFPGNSNELLNQHLLRITSGKAKQCEEPIWSDRGFGPPACMMINQWTSVTGDPQNLKWWNHNRCWEKNNKGNSVSFKTHVEGS